MRLFLVGLKSNVCVFESLLGWGSCVDCLVQREIRGNNLFSLLENRFGPYDSSQILKEFASFLFWDSFRNEKRVFFLKMWGRFVWNSCFGNKTPPIMGKTKLRDDFSGAEISRICWVVCFF